MLKTISNILLMALAFVLFLMAWQAWGPIPLLINTLIALLALKFVGWAGVRIEVGIWSILILLIAGVPGLLLLIFLSATGLAFRPKGA